ncbi:MAG: protoporphyrinogen oxidase [Actinomycetota bacterium]
MSTVTVIGGGLGGLLVGAELKRRNVDVVVLEAAGHPGGVASTVVEDGYVLEPAAGSMLLPHPHMTPILEAVGADIVPALPQAKTRFVYERGTLHEIRQSPAVVFSPLLSWGAKFRVLREPWVKTPSDGDESVLSFFARRFGPEMGLLGATLMARGVYAGDPERLSVRGAFPKIVSLEDEGGSLIRGMIARMRRRPKATPRASVHVPRYGMAGLAESLAAYLGEGFRPNWPVDSLTRDGNGWLVGGLSQIRADAVVVALAPHAAAGLVPREVRDLLDRAQYAPVAVVGLGGRAADMPIPAGFGVLVGPHAGMRSLGILFESAYAPGRAPNLHSMVKVILGGAADPEVASWGDDDLLELVREEVGRVVGTPMLPSWTKVVRHTPGIPQYNIGHLAWLRDLDAALSAHQGLHMAGWAYRGIGVTTLAEEAVKIADTLQAS